MKAVCSGVLGSVLLLLPAGAGHAAAVFGVELGDDIDRYRFESPAVSVRHELKMYEVVPPHPDSRFDTYAVDTHHGRIVRIMASSVNDRTPDAMHTLAVLRDLKQSLMERYGPPSLALGEIEDAGDELRDHLVDEGGMEVLEWDFVQERPEELGAVYVFLAGTVDENGTGASYCTLYMESPDYAELSEEARLHEEGGADMPTPQDPAASSPLQ